MEATETVIVTHENTPNGVVETRETTVERDEGDITESWLSAQFASVIEQIASRLNVLENQHQTILENQSQTLNRIPANLMELITNQQSMITSLTNQLAEMARTLLIPQPVAVAVPIPAAVESVEVTPEPVVVPAPVEQRRQRPRAV